MLPNLPQVLPSGSVDCDAAAASDARGCKGGHAGRIRASPLILHSIAVFEVTPDWIPHDQSLFQQCDDQGSWEPTEQYYLAKLALWSVIEGLIERYHEDEVCRKIINASCPSGCKTNMGRNFPFFLKQILARALQQFIWGRTAEQGARTLVGATIPGPDNHGELRRNDELHP